MSAANCGAVAHADAQVAVEEEVGRRWRLQLEIRRREALLGQHHRGDALDRVRREVDAPARRLLAHHLEQLAPQPGLHLVPVHRRGLAVAYHPTAAARREEALRRPRLRRAEGVVTSAIGAVVVVEVLVPPSAELSEQGRVSSQRGFGGVVRGWCASGGGGGGSGGGG